MQNRNVELELHTCLIVEEDERRLEAARRGLDRVRDAYQLMITTPGREGGREGGRGEEGEGRRERGKREREGGRERREREGGRKRWIKAKLPKSLDVPFLQKLFDPLTFPRSTCDISIV